ncbi:MAG: 4Fe-4S binding protein [Isosphaeraceae bacterium]
MAVLVDQKKCGGCGSCIDVCPTQALEKPKVKIEIIADRCLECGECISECPNDALRFPW